jgi:hypothetical protein
MTYAGIASGSKRNFASVAQGPRRIKGAPHQHVVGSFIHDSGGSSFGTRRISIIPGATKLVIADATAKPPRPPTATAAVATGGAGTFGTAETALVAAVLTAVVAALEAASDARWACEATALVAADAAASALARAASAVAFAFSFAAASMSISCLSRVPLLARERVVATSGLESAFWWCVVRRARPDDDDGDGRRRTLVRSTRGGF